jgi:hypothetical protein
MSCVPVLTICANSLHAGRLAGRTRCSMSASSMWDKPLCFPMHLNNISIPPPGAARQDNLPLAAAIAAAVAAATTLCDGLSKSCAALNGGSGGVGVGARRGGDRVIGHPAVRARVERRSTPTRLTIPSMHPTPTCLTIPSMRSCKLHLVRPFYRPQLIHSVDGVFSVIIHCRRPTHHKAPAAAFRELSCRDSPFFAHASRFRTGSRRPHRGGDLGTSYSTRHNRL